MNINSIINQGANVQIVVSALELKEAFLDWVGERERTEQGEETYLSVNDVMVSLNVSKPTLWRWDKAGYLSPVRVGRRTLYKKSDIERIRQGRV